MTRKPIPRGAPRTPLPQLKTLLDRQGKSQSWLTDQLGQPRQTWHNNRDAGGWPDVDVPRIAALLGVPIEMLTARGVSAPHATPTVQTLLAQPELARLADDVADAVHSQVTAAIVHAVEATVRLIAAGVVPMPMVADLKNSASAESSRPSVAMGSPIADDDAAHQYGRKLFRKR